MPFLVQAEAAALKVEKEQLEAATTELRAQARGGRLRGHNPPESTATFRSPCLTAGLPARLWANTFLLTLAWLPIPRILALPHVLLPHLPAQHTCSHAPACLSACPQTDQALADNRWKEERDAKKEADWDARLKEAYK